MLMARVAFLYSLDNSVAAQSSSLGIVSCFRGATFDVEHRSSQDFFLWSVERILETSTVCSLIAITEPMNLDVGSIGAYNLPVDLDL